MSKDDGSVLPTNVTRSWRNMLKKRPNNGSYFHKCHYTINAISRISATFSVKGSLTRPIPKSWLLPYPLSYFLLCALF